MTFTSPYDESYPPSVLNGGVPPTGVVAGTPGYFTPAGSAVPADITELRALGLSPGAAWIAGEWVVIGTGNAHWNGTDWAMGIAPIWPTNATAGTPGAFVPANATVPANVSELRTMLPTITPATPWTTGQYIVITSGNFHWTGTDWSTGMAP